MHYIIMADGKGKRWKNYKGIPKHFVEVDGEKIIARTIKLLKKFDPGCCITVTSHDPRYEFKDAVRYEPKNNRHEIDRFTEELINDNICFLYGDTYYTDSCIKKIVNNRTDDISFFGNKKIIVGIKVRFGETFRWHFNKVKTMYLNKELEKCTGWQVYQSYAGLVVGPDKVIGKGFIDIEEESFDINTPEDYMEKVLVK